VKFLVDANILSEPTRPRPAPEVVRWLSRHEADLAVDPIILGELELGVLQLDPGRKRAALERWFDALRNALTCLPFTLETAHRWARLLADLRRRGAAVPIKDSLIAATALHHGLTVVSHNTRDFKRTGVKLVDPFHAH
jgi:predicted nucleic acid-binding protein